MTVEQLRSVHQAAPFQPFTIHLPDRRPFPVPHPDFLSISPTSRIAVVYTDDGSASIIDVALITEIELRITPPNAQRNGS
ncbi:MAG TPA: hypothetical protein VFI31_28900 [Pirellulales bacterium]|nr:hypothetical protein [Pirellulales bacterium]